MSKRYDILRLLPQDKPIYIIVEALGPIARNELEYHYEEQICTSDILNCVDTVILNGDTDPHGLFEYVRTTEELEFPEQSPHCPGEEWPKVVPEAFETSINLGDDRVDVATVAERDARGARAEIARLNARVRECEEALRDAADTLEDRCTLRDGSGYIECVVCCVQWHDTTKGLGHQDDCPIRRARAVLGGA